MRKEFKNPNGRPPKLEYKQTKIIKLSLTEAEYLEIVKKANSLKLKPSVYARHMVLNGQIVDLFSDAEKIDKRKLIGMSNNLNQLAYLSNLGGVKSIDKQLHEMMNIVDDFLEKYNQH